MRGWRSWAIAALACLQAACATPGTPDHLRALPDMRDPGRIVIVGARFDPEYSFKSDIPTKGRAAAWGAFLGGGQCVEALGAGPVAGPFFLVCATVATAIASIGTATAPEAPSAAKIDAAKAQGQRALAALRLHENALQAMLRYAKVEGIALGSLGNIGPQKPDDLSSYAETRNLADTVLEVSVLHVLARAFEFSNRPYVAMSMRVRVRILSTHDGKVVDTMLLRVVAGVQTLEEWVGGGDTAISSMFDKAGNTIAEWALDELLLVYRPREMLPQEVPAMRDPVPPYALRAIEPPVVTQLLADSDGGLKIAALDGLQPELRWEAWPRGFDIAAGSGSAQARDVRYQLRIYGEGGVAYERRGLTEARHRPERPLEPCRVYRWTVRAHFTLDGTPRVTEWTGAYNTILGNADPRWVRREGSAPSLAAMPGSLLPFFPIVRTPGMDGRPCPSG
jgi:hypothetical protein